jgi:hypothetical protein
MKRRSHDTRDQLERQNPLTDKEKALIDYLEQKLPKSMERGHIGNLRADMER